MVSAIILLTRVKTNDSSRCDSSSRQSTATLRLAEKPKWSGTFPSVPSKFPSPLTISPFSLAFSLIEVHGLNPRSKKNADHAWDTWRTPAGDAGRLWLRDDLPSTLPKARIFLYEYNATAVYGKDQATFIDKANELLEAIRLKRRNAEARPIILFGHSMGGLLIKQALINAHNNSKYEGIKSATKGLVFFATPHNGGDWKLVSLGGVAAKIATKAGFQKGDDVLEVLKSGSMFSEIMNEQWRHRLPDYDIVSFWGAQDNIVPRESARLGLPGDRENVVKLNADHSSVCKFGPDQEDQDNLELVQGNIQDVFEKALKTSECSAMPSVMPGTKMDAVEDKVADDELRRRFAGLQGDKA